MTPTAAALFLPGILMPARERYVPLITALGPDGRFLTKELEVYAAQEPPPAYSIHTEVEGVERFAEDHGLDRFHLYGHSAGGAIALAYVAAHPERVLTLAVDEPATDFSEEDRESLRESLGSDFRALPMQERMARFARSLVRPEAELPPPPDAPPTPEMAKRPAGVMAFADALLDPGVDRSAFARFPRPAYYSYGSLSHPRWERMAERLSALFPSLVVDRFDGVHHLFTSHHADPERVAAALRRLWS